MGASSQADGVRALAAPIAERAGLVVEDVLVTPAGRRRVLRITVDLPEDIAGGVPMEAVAQTSQALSAALDASNLMGGAPYVLEVSSPGADRQLTERRHWSRARGRTVTVRLQSGAEAEGRLLEIDDDGIALDAGGRFGWTELSTGRVVLEFTHADSGASQPTDYQVDGPGEGDEPDEEV